jgi:hypothetical protein
MEDFAINEYEQLLDIASDSVLKQKPPNYLSFEFLVQLNWDL